MNGDVLTYDPKKNIVIFGSRQISGFSEDDIVEISPLGDGATPYVGADGDVGRSIDPNECYEVTIHLASTSKSNDYLSSVYNLDRKTGRGLYPLSIKDLSGTTVFFARQAWIQNAPKGGRGRKIDSREWVLNTGRADYTLGGND